MRSMEVVTAGIDLLNRKNGRLAQRAPKYLLDLAFEGARKRSLFLDSLGWHEVAQSKIHRRLVGCLLIIRRERLRFRRDTLALIISFVLSFLEGR